MSRHKFLSLKFFVAKKALKSYEFNCKFFRKSNKVLIGKTFESLIILTIETW